MKLSQFYVIAALLMLSTGFLDGSLFAGNEPAKPALNLKPSEPFIEQQAAVQLRHQGQPISTTGQTESVVTRSPLKTLPVNDQKQDQDQSKIDWETYLSIIAILISASVAFLVYLGARYTRRLINASILLDLTQIYSHDRVSDAVSHFKKLKSENEQDFNENRYIFGRKVFAQIESSPDERKKFRDVSSFYTDVAILVQTGLIDKGPAFFSYSPEDIAIVEVLEPILTAQVEKHYPSRLNTEWVALRLLDDARKWQKKKRRSNDPLYAIPKNPELYAKSRQSYREESGANKANPADAKNGAAD